MKRVAIVQARMTSERLPGKVLAEIEGQPMLARQLTRMRRCRQLDEIVIATTTNAADDGVVALARGEGLPWFRGDEHDVLGRFQGAARQQQADLIVRITADCPLIDPVVVDAVVALALEPGCDYASNVHPRTYPRGLDVEAFHMDVLDRMARIASSTAAREHVTYFLHAERPELFVRRNIAHAEDHSDLRWTVDTAEDLELVRQIYRLARLDEQWIDYEELVRIVRAAPALLSINAHVEQKGT